MYVIYYAHILAAYEWCIGTGKSSPRTPGGTPPQGYGFSAVLVINRVSTLANFGHFGHK